MKRNLAKKHFVENQVRPCCLDNHLSLKGPKRCHDGDVSSVYMRECVLIKQGVGDPFTAIGPHGMWNAAGRPRT